MVQKSQGQPPFGMYPKPCKEWDKLPTSTGEHRISEPSTAAWFFTSEDDFSKGFSLLFRLEELSLTDPWIDSEVHGGSIVRHFWYPSRRWCNIEDIFAKMWLTPLYIYTYHIRQFCLSDFSSEHGRQMAKGQVTLWKMDPGLGSLHKFGCC